MKKEEKEDGKKKKKKKTRVSYCTFRPLCSKPFIAGRFI